MSVIVTEDAINMHADLQIVNQASITCHGKMLDICVHCVKRPSVVVRLGQRRRHDGSDWHALSASAYSGALPRRWAPGSAAFSLDG